MGQQSSSEYDAIILGAGFAGMTMLYRLREMGLTVRVLEAGRDVGGTWCWNDCDWPEVMAAQLEILKYANHVADRFNLRPEFELSA